MALHANVKEINVFVEGVGFLGLCESFKEPVVKTKKIDSPNGAVVDSGVLDKLEAEATLRSINDIYYDAMTKLHKAKFVFKERITESSEDRTIIHTIIGSFDLEPSESKYASEKKYTLKIYPMQYTKEIDGKEVVFVDMENYICRLNSKDILEETRNAIL